MGLTHNRPIECHESKNHHRCTHTLHKEPRESLGALCFCAYFKHEEISKFLCCFYFMFLVNAYLSNHAQRNKRHDVRLLFRNNRYRFYLGEISALSTLFISPLFLVSIYLAFHGFKKTEAIMELLQSVPLPICGHRKKMLEYSLGLFLDYRISPSIFHMLSTLSNLFTVSFILAIKTLIAFLPYVIALDNIRGIMNCVCRGFQCQTIALRCPSLMNGLHLW